jgi:hypothetical protein
MLGVGMEQEIQDNGGGRFRFIARGTGTEIDECEVQFTLPPGTYIRNFVTIGAYLKNKLQHCSMQTHEGGAWVKGCPAKLSGTLRIRLTDKGDRREVIVHTTKEAAA